MKNDYKLPNHIYFKKKYTLLGSEKMFLNLLSIIKDMLLFTGSYSNQVFPEPLSSEEEEKMITKMLNGDKEARNTLIERNLRLVAHIVKKFDNGVFDTDDLISIGTIGLIKGIDSYQKSKSTKITTYAARCIENAHLTLRNYMTYSKQYLRHYKEKYRQIIQYNLQTLAELYQKQTSKQQQKTR